MLPTRKRKLVFDHSPALHDPMMPEIALSPPSSPTPPLARRKLVFDHSPPLHGPPTTMSPLAFLRQTVVLVQQGIDLLGGAIDDNNAMIARLQTLRNAISPAPITAGAAFQEAVGEADDANYDPSPSPSPTQSLSSAYSVSSSPAPFGPPDCE